MNEKESKTEQLIELLEDGHDPLKNLEDNLYDVQGKEEF
jgi:hypothetical protein